MTYVNKLALAIALLGFAAVQCAEFGGPRFERRQFQPWDRLNEKSINNIAKQFRTEKSLAADADLTGNNEFAARLADELAAVNRRDAERFNINEDERERAYYAELRRQDEERRRKASDDDEKEPVTLTREEEDAAIKAAEGKLKKGATLSHADRIKAVDDALKAKKKSLEPKWYTPVTSRINWARTEHPYLFWGGVTAAAAGGIYALDYNKKWRENVRKPVQRKIQAYLKSLRENGRTKAITGAVLGSAALVAGWYYFPQIKALVSSGEAKKD